MKRHSLIVGGTRGMGRILVKKWAMEGHCVSVIGRRAASEADARIENVRYWVADILDKAAVEKALDQIVKKNGPLNDLVFFQRYHGQGDPWEGELATSLTATKNIIDLLSDRFTEKGGAIATVGSVITQFVAGECSMGYLVAKAGLEQMVRYYAVQLAGKGIRVNGVAPCTTEKEESREFYRGNKELTELYRKIIPLGRIATSEEIAEVIAFLCGPQSSFITGQNLVVDGGFSLIWQESLARKLALPAKLK